MRARDGMQGRIVGVIALAALAGSLARSAEIQEYGKFQITYYVSGESYGGYTADKNWTTDDRSCVTSTIDMWQSYIGNVPGRDLQLHVMWNDLPGLTLGASSNPIYGYAGTAFSLTEYVWRYGGVDDPSGADLFLLFDTGTSWNKSTGDPSGAQIDLRSVMAHEIGHSLGFLSTYSSGSDTWWSGGITVWDSYLRDQDEGGNAPVAGGTGTPGNFNQLDNPVYFTGPNAVSAYGAPVPVYAPTTYEPGSSLTHVNDDNFSNALMEHAIGYGDVRRRPLAVELAILKDLGWTIIPEPSSLLLLLSGLLALASRRPRAPATGS